MYVCYEFLSKIASSVLKVNCYQWGSCVRGPSAFNSPFGHRSRSHNICPLDNHLSGLSISLSSLVLSWVYRLPFFKSLVWLGCDSNSQPSVLVASTLPLHYQSVCSYKKNVYLSVKGAHFREQLTKWMPNKICFNFLSGDKRNKILMKYWKRERATRHNEHIPRLEKFCEY